MKKITLLVLASTLLLWPISAASGQSYSFSVDSAQVNAFFNADGTLDLSYEYLFTNQPGAAAIDYVDIGLPNSNFTLDQVSAEVDGQPLTDIQQADAQYLNGTNSGVTVGLGSRAIQPGASGVFVLRVNGIRKVMYQYSQGDLQNYASVRIMPNYFGSQYVTGSTNLTVSLHLPPGIGPDEPRWEQAKSPWPGSPDPETSYDSQQRVTYTWSSGSASSATAYEFAAAFPASYVPAEEVYNPTLFTFDPTLLFCGCISMGFLLVIGFSFYSAIWGAKKRRMKYLPPKLSIEGHGIKRGLTAVEAAIVMEQPMDKVLTMILFGTIKKAAASVRSKTPLEVDVADPAPAGLQPYETEFLAAFKQPAGRERQNQMQEVVVNLVKSVSEKMKGFSRPETVAYYNTIYRQAWEQIKAAETPEIQSQRFDDNLEWTLLDRDYKERMDDTFRQGPVILPRWWGHFDPTATTVRPVSTGSIPSQAGGTSGKPVTVSMPSLPGAAFASSMVTGIQNFASGVVGDISSFTSKVSNRTNPPPPPSTFTSHSSGGGGGHSCACACACAGCACACAGGGR